MCHKVYIFSFILLWKKDHIWPVVNNRERMYLPDNIDSFRSSFLSVQLAIYIVSVMDVVCSENVDNKFLV